MRDLIDCHKVSKIYKQGDFEVSALKNISFTLKEGDRLGILGLNGAGKSTLLNIIGGFIKPTDGTVYLSEKVTSLSGFDSLLNPDLTGEQNAKLQLKIMGVHKTEIDDLLIQINLFSELGDALFRPVKTYSSGMMLRLTFGIFSASNPKLLLLDEVLSTGDYIFQRKVKNLLNEKITSTSGLIITSHVMSDIYQYCNKCMVIEKGEIKFMGGVEEAFNFYKLSNVENVVTENEFIKLIKCSNASTNIKVSSEIELSFKYEQKIEGNIDGVIALYKEGRKIFSSCILYDENYKNHETSKGVYELSAIIPSHFLHIGKYSVGIVFGDGEKDLLHLDNLIDFEVFPDDWEKDKLWNQQENDLLRPQLQWNKSKL